MDFKARVFQDPCLAEGTTAVTCILTVTPVGLGKIAAISKGGKLVLGFVLDNSGSMKGDKLAASKMGTEAAINALDQSQSFFVVAGDEMGTVIVPTTAATAEAKANAIARVHRMTADSGTYFSRWLKSARTEFAKNAGGINILVFLTDGKNEGETDPSALVKELAACKGSFQAHCRGVGSDWRPDELRMVSEQLKGTTDMIKDPASTAAEFKAIVTEAKGLEISSAIVQMWVPKLPDGTMPKVTCFKQMTPQVVDMTKDLKPGADAQTSVIDTGAWGAATPRDYMITYELPKAGAPGGPKQLAGRVAFVTKDGATEKFADITYTDKGEEKVGPKGLVVAAWTNDLAEATSKMDPTLANYSGQAELTKKIQEGLQARAQGRDADATKALQRAVELADQTNNEGTKKLLAKVVDREQDGTVKLKKNVSASDVVELDTSSTRTKRITS